MAFVSTLDPIERRDAIRRGELRHCRLCRAESLIDDPVCEFGSCEVVTLHNPKARTRAKHRGVVPCPHKCGRTFATVASAEQHARDLHSAAIAKATGAGR